MIKLIASDMDGTLLGSKMEVLPENIEAIRFAEAQGIKFMVATGRSHTEALPALEEAGISCPMITVNGAQAFDENGRELFTIDINHDNARKIMSALENAGAYYEIATNKGVYSNNQHQRIENSASMLASHLPHLTFKMAIAMAAARLQLLDVKYVADYQELFADDSIKLLKFFVSSSNGPTYLQNLRETIELVPDVIITSSFADNLEINHVDAQKGIAVKHVAENLGIPLNEVMTIGDNYNDASMLQIAGVSFAMANAEEGVKKLARYETTHHTEGGVGKAIHRAIAENL